MIQQDYKFWNLNSIEKLAKLFWQTKKKCLNFEIINCFVINHIFYAYGDETWVQLNEAWLFLVWHWKA